MLTTTNRCKVMARNSRNASHNTLSSKVESTPEPLHVPAKRGFELERLAGGSTVRGLPRVDKGEEVVATESVAAGVGASKEEA